MKKQLIILSIGLVLAACASAPNTQANRNNAYANSSPSGAALEASATPETVSGGVKSGSKPMVITVRPPILLLGPGQGTPGLTPVPFSPPRWLTFTSPELGAAVDYPSGWSATQQGNIITFQAPQGQIIRLQPATPETPDSKCTSLINASGLTVNACVNTATGLYNASFGVSGADGSTQNLMLATTDPAAVETYKRMLNSLRPVH
jgi:hypothetical protein